MSATIITNATARLDRLKWSSWHTQTTLLLSVGWALDAFETSIMSPLLSSIQHEFGIESVTEASWMTSAWLVGGVVGALLFGWIGDRYGRKTTFIITILWYSLCTIVTACAPNYYIFLIFRALTSVGVAGEYSSVTASIAEFVPAKHRGKLSVLIQGTWGIGALIANAVDILLVNYLAPNMAWRVGCSLGACAGLFTLVARRHLPESPRWLLAKGRVQEAESIVANIENICKQPDNAVGIHKSEYNLQKSHGFFAQCWILLTKFPLYILFACTLDVSQAFGSYGVTNFLSLVVLPATMKEEAIPTFYTIAYLGVFPGILFSAWLIDVIGRKKLLPLAYTLCILSCCCIYPAYLSKNESNVIATGFAYQLFYASSWGCAYSMYSEIFPTFIRSTGIGMAVAVGRLGGFAAPLLTGVIYEKTTPDGKNVLGALLLMISFFMISVVAAIPWAIWGTEGNGLSLEDACGESLQKIKLADPLDKKALASV